MSLLSCYKHQVEKKHLRIDKRQQQVVRVLDAFAKQLYESSRATYWLFQRKQPPQSLYLYGNVGRGKTMLMDLLYQSITVPKERFHFSKFMLWLHAELKRVQGKKNPLNFIAASISKRIDLLCFDELQVDDIADAMLLGRFFNHLLDTGIVLCVTSNLHPSQLYANGLQRERFMPVIKRIEQHFLLIPMLDGSDYRRFDTLTVDRYLTPANNVTQDRILLTLCQLQDAPPVENSVLLVNNRPIHSTALFHRIGAAVFNFDALCANNCSSGDYLQLARDWTIFALTNIPRMHDNMLTELRRFIMLVDQLYENQCTCLFSAETSIDELYNGKTLQTEFARCASRLYSLQHRPIHQKSRDE